MVERKDPVIPSGGGGAFIPPKITKRKSNKTAGVVFVLLMVGLLLYVIATN